jgi:hypothetical protein
VPESERQGLSFDELKKGIGRYRYVAAAPIIQQVDGNIITVGCVVIDIPSTDDTKTLPAAELQKLMAPVVVNALKEGADVAANILP